MKESEYPPKDYGTRIKFEYISPRDLEDFIKNWIETLERVIYSHELSLDLQNVFLIAFFRSYLMQDPRIIVSKHGAFRYIYNPDEEEYAVYFKYVENGNTHEEAYYTIYTRPSKKIFRYFMRLRKLFEDYIIEKFKDYVEKHYEAKIEDIKIYRKSIRGEIREHVVAKGTMVILDTEQHVEIKKLFRKVCDGIGYDYDTNKKEYVLEYYYYDEYYLRIIPSEIEITVIG